MGVESTPGRSRIILSTKKTGEEDYENDIQERVRTTTTIKSSSKVLDDNVETEPITISPTLQQQQQNKVSNIHKDEMKTFNISKDDSKSSSWRTMLQNSIFLGIKPTLEIFAVMTIYFVQGALGLARLAQTFLLKDELHLGPAELSALAGIFTIPWTIKPLYGFLSDGFPLANYRRRSYLVLCGLVGGLAYLTLGNTNSILSFIMTTTTTIHDNNHYNDLMLRVTIACFLVSAASVAFCDVVADGIVVQKTRQSQDPRVAGGLQSLCWGSAAAGGLLSSYFSGSLLEQMSPYQVFSLTAFLPLVVCFISFFIQEEPVVRSAHVPKHKSESGEEVTNANTDAVQLLDKTDESSQNENIEMVRQQIEALWNAIRQESIWKPALFVFLWRATPTSDSAFFYFITNELHMGPEFLGRARLVSSVAGLLGVWVYQRYLRTVSIKNILYWSTLVSAPLGLSSLLLVQHWNRALGIPDGAFVLGDDVVLGILGQVAFLPTLVLAARLCPPGVEAVLFATLMSIFNGASTVATEVGAGLTKYFGVTESNFDNLGLLTIICNISSLLPLLFIGYLDGVGDKSEEDIEREEQEEEEKEIVT